MSGVRPRGSQASVARTPQSTIIFGNAGNTSWDVEYELRDIHAFVRETRLYFDRDASLAALQREEGDGLHCALDIHTSHARRGASYIVFSGGRGYRTAAYVRFGELFAVAPFATVLVSNLSARSPDASLPLIFQINGTESVIMNNIAATRKAKKMFNAAFYSFLTSGNGPAVAYRNAVLQMIKDPEYRAPGLWGPFFLW